MKSDPLQSAEFHKLLQYFRMDRYEEKSFGGDKEMGR